MDTFDQEVVQQNNIKQIQWFPGHMARARRVLAENLKLVDIVAEIVDARIPVSSRNPEIDRLIGQKPRVIIASKKDLADPDVCNRWKNYYAKEGIRIIFVDSKKGDGIKNALAEIKSVLAEKMQRKQEKGMRQVSIKTMVVGIPNVGKSSFINRVAGKAAAVTGDKPGVTRNKQWLKMNEDMYLLDTPGLLWPKFEDQEAAMRLCCTGAIKDDILDVAEIAGYLLDFIRKNYPAGLERFKISPEFAAGDVSGLDLLTECGRRRGCLVKGGEVDVYRAAGIVLDEYRAGKAGRISLDLPGLPQGEDKNDG